MSLNPTILKLFAVLIVLSELMVIITESIFAKSLKLKVF